MQFLPDGTISLKYDHPYYTQVQLQILVTRAQVGYFCVRTAHPDYNLHWQEVYMNRDYLEEIVSKGHIKKGMQEASFSHSID